MKLREIRISRGRQQKELAIIIGTDEPTFSRFEHYKCLPTPVMLEKLIKELDCTVFDLYEPHELYLQDLQAPKKPRKQSGVGTYYRMTVKLAPDAKLFVKDAVKECGYKSITEWVNKCLCDLQKQYAKILKKEKDSTSEPGSK